MFSKCVKNTVGKGEFARYEQFIPPPHPHTHTHLDVYWFQDKLISSENVKNPHNHFTKSPNKHQNKPGEYHEWFQPEVSTLSMSISA